MLSPYSCYVPGDELITGFWDEKLRMNQRRSSESHCYHFIGTAYFYCEHYYFEKHCRAVPLALR